MKRLYLAGPDVFLPDADAVGRAKVDLCAQHGFKGLFPLDQQIDAVEEDLGRAIYRANLGLMKHSDAIIANLSPFRGPSADVGTAFELGWFAGRNLPIFAYSNDEREFAERTRFLLDLAPDAARDRQGLGIEPFGLADNLMLPGAVGAAGGVLVCHQSDGLEAMSAFKRCLDEVSAYFTRREQAKYNRRTT